MYKRSIIIVIEMLATMIVFAQDGLSVERFFAEDYASQPGINSVCVSGKQMTQLDCGISLYRCVAIKSNTIDIDQIESAVKKDGIEATYRTVSMTDGHIYYGFYALPPLNNNKNRYIIFKRQKKSDYSLPPNATIADITYIESTASPDELISKLRSISKSK